MASPPTDPGDLLLERVAGTTDRAWFRESGAMSVRELERTLALAGRTLDSFTSILDFGCGCGRVLLWLGALEGRCELHGTDIDAEAVAWAAEHIPYARFAVNQPDPPLPHPDGAFDLVISHSVFTHIDERRQDAWLTELHRVTRPGGLLVLSVHGEHALGAARTPAHDHLERHGHLFMPESRPPARLGHPDWYAVAYHAPWYVYEHWGRWFAIRAHIPRAALEFQDQVLLERTPAPPPAPLRARPGPPAPAVGAAEARVLEAHARLGAGPSRWGSLGVLARRAVLRLLRPYTAHQAAIDLALARSIDERSAAGEAPDAP